MSGAASDSPPRPGQRARICDDVLVYGPLEPLLARDDFADITVNGQRRNFIEVDGKLDDADIRFRDNSLRGPPPDATCA